MMTSPHNGGNEDEVQLLERVHASARAIARRLVKSRDRADDIAQDVAADCLARLRGGTWDVEPERLEAYLATIVVRRRNLMRLWRRQTAARDWTYLREIAASTRSWMDPEVQWRERELAALYDATLDSLAPRCRGAFIAVREQGQSYAEAARSQGVSVKMIAKYITEAQRVFRGVLRARGIRVPPEKGRRAPTAFVSRITRSVPVEVRTDANDGAAAERAARERAREAEHHAQLAAFRRAGAFLKAELAAREAEEGGPVELEPIA
ncbi:MAG TPA: sigma factor-like helix-turn-helix DNA-binding protein [Gemmatimonadaceae bacterium]